MKNNRVVITGIGTVTYNSEGNKTFWENLINQKKLAQPIPEEFKKYHNYKSQFYIPLPNINNHLHLIPSKLQRIMQPEDKMATIALIEALKNSQITFKQQNGFYAIENINNSAIILGTGFSGLETAFTSYLAHLNSPNKIKKQDLSIALPRYNRMVIPLMMPNSPAAWLSIIFQQKGESFTLNAACASGTIAIGNAFNKIKNGNSEMVITGGVECLHEKTGAIMRGFDILNTLTKTKNGNPVPFSNNRSGFLFSEGAAAILILEDYEHAKKRKAPIYAEIVDYRSISDCYNIVQMDPTGENVYALLKMLKGNNKIDYLNTHGTGTISNDQIEANAIIKIFGDKNEQPIINSSKSILGHSIGASGALETAITAMSIKNSLIHGQKVETPISNINLALSTKNVNINYAITSSYGFGGHFGGLLLKKCEN